MNARKIKIIRFNGRALHLFYDAFLKLTCFIINTDARRSMLGTCLQAEERAKFQTMKEGEPKMSDTSIPRANTRIGTVISSILSFKRINTTKQSPQIRSFLLKTEPIWYNISFVLALFPSTRKELIMGKI